MHRHHVNKRRAAKGFRRNVQRTKMINLAPPPTRGGYRL